MIRLPRYLIALFVASILFLPGCGATMTQSAHEHAELHRQVNRRDRLALSEDVDLVLQRDRATRLSRWHER
jgi:hypothetical protein